MDDINDRGTIKWTSIMMPEHIKMLNDYWKTTEYKDKPTLDEQELEEIGMKLQMAIHDDLPVEVKYFKDHDYKVVVGKIEKLDNQNKILTFRNINRTKVGFTDIIHVTIL